MTHHSAPANIDHLEERLFLAANLVVSSVRLEGLAIAGQNVTVKYELTNAGDVAAEGWQDLVQVAKADSVLMNNMTPAAARAINGWGWADHDEPLDPGQTITVTTNAQLMPGLTGSYKLLVAADWEGQLDEEGLTADNVAWIPVSVTLPPPVDLSGDGAVVGPAVVGQDVAIAWTATNISPNEALAGILGGWEDNVYWSRDSKLGKGDVLLGSYQQALAVAAGAQYGGALTVQLPTEALGEGFIIVQVNGNGQAAESRKALANNLIVQPVTVEGLGLRDFHSGQFIARSSAALLGFDAYFGPGAAATVDVTLGGYQAFGIADIPGGGATAGTLVNDLVVGLGPTRSAFVVDTSGLAFGTYTMTITIDRGGSVTTRQINVSLVEAAVSKTDALGDTVGGINYEHYNLDAGLVGDYVIWRLGTNHWSYGSEDNGDFLLRVGKGKSGQLVGLALADRETDTGANVLAGRLYSGCKFTPGEVVPKYLAKISTFQTEQAGDSLVWVDEDTKADWSHDLWGAVKIQALGIDKTGDAGKTPVTISHTMYCGNDEITIDIVPLLVRWPKLAVNQEKPQVLKLSAAQDKIADPAVVGQYTPNKALTLKATVKAAKKDPVVAVVWEVNGQVFVDDSPKGGWSMPFTTELADTPLRIRAISKAGVVSDYFDGLVKLV